jgi:uncharacterized membrane protein
MAFCPKCGNQLPEGAMFCAKCGNQVGAPQQQPQQPQYQPAPVKAAPAPKPPKPKRELPPEVADNRWMAVLCYLGMMIFFPCVLKKDVAFVRFHINQGIVLLLLMIAACVVCVIPFLGWLAAVVVYVFSIVCIIMGIVNAARGVEKELPIIGKIKVLKD